MGIGEDAEVIRVIHAREEQATPGHGIRPLAYFAREGIRSDSGSDWRLRYALRSEMARNERDVMVSRRKRSIHQLQAQGRFSGRGVPPWGYRSAPHPSGAGRTLVVDPTEAAASARPPRASSPESPPPPSPMTSHDAASRRLGARPAELSSRASRPRASLRASWASGASWPPCRLRAPRGVSPPHSHEARGRQGSYVLAEDGNPLQAFEPVLSAATFAALHGRFPRGQGRGSQRKRKAARLGSGLVYGQCGAKAYVLTSASYTYYRCSAKSIGRVDCLGQSLQTAVTPVEGDTLVEFGHGMAYEAIRGEYTAASGLARKIWRIPDDATEVARSAALTAFYPNAGQIVLARPSDATVSELARILAVHSLRLIPDGAHPNF